MDRDASNRQRRHIGRVESLQSARGHLGRSVPAIQLVVEEHSNFGDVVTSGHDDGADEVVSAVAPGLEDGDLEGKMWRRDEVSSGGMAAGGERKFWGRNERRK